MKRSSFASASSQREQDIDPHELRDREDEIVLERLLAFAVVEEVLLGLIEDEIDVTLADGRDGIPERFGRRDSG